MLGVHLENTLRYVYCITSSSLWLLPPSRDGWRSCRAPSSIREYHLILSSTSRITTIIIKNRILMIFTSRYLLSGRRYIVTADHWVLALQTASTSTHSYILPYLASQAMRWCIVDDYTVHCKYSS